MSIPSGERSDRPGGGSGREDQRPWEFFRGTPAETGIYGGDATTGKTRRIHCGQLLTVLLPDLYIIFNVTQTIREALRSVSHPKRGPPELQNRQAFTYKYSSTHMQKFQKRSKYKKLDCYTSLLSVIMCCSLVVEVCAFCLQWYDCV